MSIPEQLQTPNYKRHVRLVGLVSRDYTENITQNSTVIGHADYGLAEIERALAVTPADHPARHHLMNVVAALQGIKAAEFEEDLRHKGIAGLMDDCLPELKKVLNTLQAMKEAL